MGHKNVQDGRLNPAPANPTAAFPPTPSLEAMVERMRSGDTDAVAWFLERYGPLIQRRLRSKLGPAMRRLYDSQEMLSTVSRRLLRFVALGKLHARSESELWTLVSRVTHGALIDKIRAVKLLRSTEGPDSPFAAMILSRIQPSSHNSFANTSPTSTPCNALGDSTATDDALLSAIEFGSLFELLPSADDKEILTLWLHGVPHPQIAQHLGISPDAVRQRWQSVKARLRQHLLQEVDR